MIPFQIRKLGYALGGIVTGIDLRNPLDAETVTALRQEWLDRTLRRSRVRRCGNASQRMRTSKRTDSMTERVTSRLRGLINTGHCVIASGVADALDARLVAREGFEVVYMTGFGTSVTRLGVPDVGLLTATEMFANARAIADSSELPVVADADNRGSHQCSPHRAGQRVSDRLRGIPLLYNVAASGKSPDLSVHDLGRLGFRLAIYPNWMLVAAIPAMQIVLRELRATGTIAGIRDKVTTFKEFAEIAGLEGIQRLEALYGVPEERRTRV